MIDQYPLTEMQKYLNQYACASAAEKKKAREKMMVCYSKDTSRFLTKNHSVLNFNDWCEIMRNTQGYNVSHAEIKQRLNVSDGWINNNIKPVVRWFRTKATREKGESSVFYNRNDLNNYLLNGCNFAMRTVPENVDRSKLVRVILQDFITRGHKLTNLKIAEPILQHQIAEASAQYETKQAEAKAEDDSIDPFVDLSSEHRTSVDAFLAGELKNLFITGGAGTGKTFLTKAIIEKIKVENKNVLICAPTAIAALNIDSKYGRTLHSVFKINKDEVIPYNTTGNADISEQIINADVIVIDEISMVRMDVFKYVIKTIEAAEKLILEKINLQDSGSEHVSKQCLFVGDFFQLSPVVSKEDTAELVASGWSLNALNRGGFCFFTEEWQNRITKENFIELSKIHRQENEEFIAMLNELRTANDVDVKIRLRKQLNKFVRAYPEKTKS